MFTLTTPNTNTAMAAVYSYLHDYGVEEDSRNGPVLRAPEPVLITYTAPMQRVNFCPVRDANPFFHLAESIWMLAGREDSASMEAYLPSFANYADNGIINAAYGYRSRREWGDQLNAVILELSNNPNTRQAVVQLWSPHKDLGTVFKDKACNMSLVFQRNPVTNCLDMHIMNRSNDAIWGGVSGANVVHMAFFLEYVALFAEMLPGYIHTYSANLHVYLDNPKLDMLLATYSSQYQLDYNPYEENSVEWIPIATTDYSRSAIDAKFRMAAASYVEYMSDPFFSKVFAPMYKAHSLYKSGDLKAALETVRRMPPQLDWRLAAEAWLLRRWS